MFDFDFDASRGGIKQISFYSHSYDAMRDFTTEQKIYLPFSNKYKTKYETYFNSYTFQLEHKIFFNAPSNYISTNRLG